MRKGMLTIGAICTLLLLTACAQVPVCPNQLIFNTPELVRIVEKSSDSAEAAFHQHIGYEELRVVFPELTIPAHPVWGTALYQADGSLVEVLATIPFFEEEVQFPQIRIRIRVGESPPFFQTYEFAEDTVFQDSDIYGVIVVAQMVEYRADRYSFEAMFTLDGIGYHIRFSDSGERGRARMTELVTGIIQGGTEGFAVLADPVIPAILEMRDEWLTFEEAFLDPDFGGYIPSYIPDEFTFLSAHRSIFEQLDENRLFLDWFTPHNSEAYLYDIYTQWLAGRTLDMPALPFEQINWLGGRIWWTIEAVGERDLERLVGYPIFPAEELTLDAIRATEELVEWSVLGVARDDDWDWEQWEAYEDDIFIPVESSMMTFGVLFDDVVIHVTASATPAGEIAPEVIWAMFESLI